MAIIDVSDRYHNATYQWGGTTAWALNRNNYPVRARILHHSAGFYTYALRTNPLGATQDEEMVELDAMAADHYNVFGIGPAYNYAVFPSGRAYFIGKVWTHRAHTVGRNPATRERWNIDGVAVVAMGNYEVDAPSGSMLAGLTEVFAAIGDQPQYKHGTIPTVDSNGIPYSQGTTCPGRHLNSYEQAPVPMAPNVENNFKFIETFPWGWRYTYELNVLQHWDDPSHVGPEVNTIQTVYVRYDAATGRHKYSFGFDIGKHW